MAYSQGREMLPPPVYVFSPLDVSSCFEIADLRQKYARWRGQVNLSYDPRRQLFIERIGVLGEWATLNALPGAFLPLDHIRPDPGIDGDWRGYTLGVKASTADLPGLVFDRRSPLIADLGLVWKIFWPEGEPPQRAQFVGWLDRPTFENRCQDFYEYGLRVPHSQLWTWPQLLLEGWRIR